MTIPLLPLWFQKPVLFHETGFKQLTISPSPQGFRFIATSSMVPLALAEFFDAAGCFPIIFMPASDGRILPHALLGLHQNENLFVNQEGKWLGRYRPACIRCYPFMMTETGDGREAFYMDQSFDGFNTKEGVLLFENGVPKPEMFEIQSFIRNFSFQIRQTAHNCKVLADTGLLVPIPAIKDFAANRQNGMLKIDEHKLRQLPDKDIVKLFRNGLLSVMQTHLFSLGNIVLLQQRKKYTETTSTERNFSAQPSQETPMTETPEKTVFLTLNHSAFSFRQPMRQIRMTLLLPDIPPDWHKLDQWLRNAWELDIELDNRFIHTDERTEQTELAINLAWRCLMAAGAILRAGGIPVFDVGCILQTEPNRQNPSEWIVVVALPLIDEIPETFYQIAMETALQNIQKRLREAHPGQSSEQDFIEIINKALEPMKSKINAGRSTIPVLRVARQNNIPFFHIGAGVYQLGWGCQSQRIDRSISGKDSLLGAKISQNKAWSASLLRRAGLPASEHEIADSENEALEAARKLGWPVVVKPADLDRGEGVSLQIKNDPALLKAFKAAYRKSKIKKVLIEREVSGICHRLFVAHGQLLYAVKRLPKSILGDGLKTVKDLIGDANYAEQVKAPWLRLEPFPCDTLAIESMRRAGFTLASVPDAGSLVPLRPVESTQWGGEDEDMTHAVHPDNLNLALRAASLFDLQVAGIDLISLDISVPWHENGAIINEINFAPTLGDGNVSRKYIPLFLKNFMEGDGRIPVDIFIGGSQAMIEAKARHQSNVQKKISCFLTSDSLTLDPSGAPLSFTFQSLFKRCRALLMNRQVEKMILVAQTDEWLFTGLPVDKFSFIARIDNELSSWNHLEEKLPQNRIDALTKLISP